MPLRTESFPILLTLFLLVVAGCVPVELSVSPTGEVLIPREEGYLVFHPGKKTVTNWHTPKTGKPAFALFSPNGEKALILTKDSNFRVELLPGPGKAPKKLLSASNVTYAQWASDGKHLTLSRVADKKVAPLKENMPELILVETAAATRKELASNILGIHRWFPDAAHVLLFQVASKSEKGDRYTGQLAKVKAANGETTPLVGVLGKKDAFYSISPDGKTVLFTALHAFKIGSKLPEIDENAKPKLWRFDIPAGKLESVRDDVAFAIFSPKGRKVLLGSRNEENGKIKLTVTGADLQEGLVVTKDAAKSAGGGMGDTRTIYPSWLDDETVLFIRPHAAFGTAGMNLHLTSVGADGKNQKDLQADLESGIGK